MQGLEGREKLRGHEADTEVTQGPPTEAGGTRVGEVWPEQRCEWGPWRRCS